MFGMFEASEAVVQQRLSICETCEHYNKTIAQCKKCGCFMNYKTKMKSSSCPIGKWNKED